MDNEDRSPKYAESSLTLAGAVMLGTGVMIGAGIFSLTGQMAELSGSLFPIAFLSAAIVVSFSAYSYVKMSASYPSAGGIAMYLHKAYGDKLPTAFNALLMYFSMVIAQSFLARTFGAYTLQLFDMPDNSIWVPVLGVALLIAAFLINLSKNQIVEAVASFIGILKLAGIVLFGAVGVWLAEDIHADFTQADSRVSWEGFLAATALGILAFKGFTTITNSGSELTEPHKNVGRAILISIALCVVIYALVGFAVASNLSIDQIIETKNYSLAAAARPALGALGLWFTVILAMAATAGGIIASIFAVSRMLAMLTQMRLVAHSHFGMPGSIQKHTLVYTVVLGIFLTAFFDLTRIAALGIIFYLIMDIAVHWGILRYLRKEIGANAVILVSAILLDLAVLGGFVWVKIGTDVTVIGVALGAMAVIFVSETIFLKRRKADGSR